MREIIQRNFYRQDLNVHSNFLMWDKTSYIGYLMIGGIACLTSWSLSCIDGRLSFYLIEDKRIFSVIYINYISKKVFDCNKQVENDTYILYPGENRKKLSS